MVVLTVIVAIAGVLAIVVAVPPPCEELGLVTAGVVLRPPLGLQVRAEFLVVRLEILHRYLMAMERFRPVPVVALGAVVI